MASGFGTFRPAVDYPLGGEIGGLAIADFNGDGRRDIAAGNYTTGEVQVLRGRKKGKFADPVGHSVGATSGPWDVARGDLNSDGRPDVVVAENGLGQVGVLLGRKGGQFKPVTHYAAGDLPYGVATGDVNGDGRSDVVDVETGDATISLRLAKKDGSLGSRQIYTAGVDPYYAVLRDFDRDGHGDVATADYGGDAVLVRFGKPNGTLGAEKVLETGADTGPFPITAADFNRDGRPDIAVGNYSSGEAGVLYGKSHGRGFASARTFPATGAGQIYGIAAADLNRDGRLELAVSAYSDKLALVLRGKNGKRFGSPTPVLVGDGASEIGIGRFNSDKAPDMATANENSESISVLLNR